MTDEFSPKQEGYNKINYSEKQKYVLDNVITKYGGNAIEAAKGAGYNNPYQALKSLRTELIELAEDVLVRFAIPAALKQGEILTSDDIIPQANEKLAAAREILSKTNPKTQKIEVEGELKGGIFILPNKQPINE